MKRSFIGLLILFSSLSFFAFGCDDQTPASDQKMNEQQEQIAAEAAREVNLPSITNFYEKRLLKRVYELRDNNKLINYAYSQSLSGKFVYLGRCIGFGIPYSTQFTNPMKVGYTKYQTGVVTLPQADPNGLFSPPSCAGTWIELLDAKGNPNLTYMEPYLTVTQQPLRPEVVIGDGGSQ